MKCKFDKKELVLKKKYNAEMKTVVFQYYHCEKCDRNYDKDRNEIILKGLGYILKKDYIDPMM